jgi:hypothetical protein
MGYVDDTYLIAVSSSISRNNKLVAKAHEQCSEWADKHGAEFNPKKYTVMHFAGSKTLKRDGEKVPRIEGVTKKSVTTELNILGVTLQSNLKWKAHVDNVCKKVSGIANAFRKTTSSAYGVRQNFKRRLYVSTARSVLTYACAAWHCPRGLTSNRERHEVPKSYLGNFEVQQNKFLRLILGALRHTRCQVLRKESFVETLAIYLDCTSLSTRARLLGTDVWTTIVNARNSVQAACTQTTSAWQLSRRVVHSQSAELDEQVQRFWEKVRDDTELEQWNALTTRNNAIKSAARARKDAAMEEEWEQARADEHDRAPTPAWDPT